MRGPKRTYDDLLEPQMENLTRGAAARPENFSFINIMLKKDSRLLELPPLLGPSFAVDPQR